MGGLNSGSRLRSGKWRDDQLHRLTMKEVRRAFAATSLSTLVEPLHSVGAGVSIQLVEGDEYLLRILRDDGPGTVPYGLVEARASASPRVFVPIVATKPHFGCRFRKF